MKIGNYELEELFETEIPSISFIGSNFIVGVANTVISLTEMCIILQNVFMKSQCEYKTYIPHQYIETHQMTFLTMILEKSSSSICNLIDLEIMKSTQVTNLAILREIFAFLRDRTGYIKKYQNKKG